MESFEVQGTAYDQKLDVRSAIQQCVDRMVCENPSYGFKVKFFGDDQMVAMYHCFEMDLPSRLKEVEAEAETRLNEFQKRLKKDFKSFAGKALKLKEKRDQRAVSTEKVSLNSRYYYRSSRTYDVG